MPVRWVVPKTRRSTIAEIVAYFDLSSSGAFQKRFESVIEGSAHTRHVVTSPSNYNAMRFQFAMKRVANILVNWIMIARDH